MSAHAGYRKNMKVDQKSRIPVALAERMSGLGGSLRGLRVHRRLTQEDVAIQGQFSRQTVARIERGDPSVAWGQVARYAELVGAPQLLSVPAPVVEESRNRRVRLTTEEKTQKELH